MVILIHFNIIVNFKINFKYTKPINLYSKYIYFNNFVILKSLYEQFSKVNYNIWTT